MQEGLRGEPGVESSSSATSVVDDSAGESAKEDETPPEESGSEELANDAGATKRKRRRRRGPKGLAKAVTPASSVSEEVKPVPIGGSTCKCGEQLFLGDWQCLMCGRLQGEVKESAFGRRIFYDPPLEKVHEFASGVWIVRTDRGERSEEKKVLRDARKRLLRAQALGYQNIFHRWQLDRDFRDTQKGHGWTRQTALRFDALGLEAFAKTGTTGGYRTCEQRESARRLVYRNVDQAEPGDLDPTLAGVEDRGTFDRRWKRSRGDGGGRSWGSSSWGSQWGSGWSSGSHSSWYSGGWRWSRSSQRSTAGRKASPRADREVSPSSP